MLPANIRSIRKYWHFFRLIGGALESLVDVFVLTEIDVPDSSLSLLCLTGYEELFRTRQNGRGGGLAVFLKGRWIVSEVNTSFTSVECIGLKIDTSKCSVTILALYRPPSMNVLFF